jgi:hypothetical protein
MKRIAIVCAASLILLQAASAAEPTPQQSRPSRAPSLTSDDLLSPGASSLIHTEDKLPASSGPALQNARSVLERMMTKMSEVRSVRTRVQAVLDNGPREVLIETVAPDRVHAVLPEGEMIVIGSTLYMKRDGSWQVSKVPGGDAARNSEFGVFRHLFFGALVKELMAKSGVRITGHSLGDHVLDGVDALAYRFEVSDRSETGSIQVSVGKQDGYIRRMSISGRPALVDGAGGLMITVWFSNINEPFSIEPPM